MEYIELRMTKEQYKVLYERMRKEMDCNSGHCAGCVYYNEFGGCDLAESIYSGEVCNNEV